MKTLKFILGQSAYFVINKKLLMHLGFDATLFLQHLIDLYENYFQKRDTNEFFQKQRDIQEATCLSPYQQRKAIEKLVQVGFITVVKKGIPAQNWYTIDTDKILNFMSSTDLTLSGKKSARLDRKKVYDINKEKINKEKNKEKVIKKKVSLDESLLLNLADEIKQEYGI